MVDREPGLAPELFVAAESFIGRRRDNQDRCAAWSAEGWSVLAVADGMGGAQGGGTASECAMGEVRRFCEWVAARNGNIASRELRAGLGNLFADANAAIFERARDNPELHGMGTTLVVAVLLGRRLFVAHAGDSRAYLIRPGSVEPLTRDHNVREERADLMEGGDFIYASSLTRSVGDTPSVRPDIYPAPTAAEDAEDADDGDDDVPDHRVADGEAVLLCSDGLSGTLSDADLRSAFYRAATPAVAARLAIRDAFDRGGTDNISVAILQVGKPPRSGSLVQSAELPVASRPLTASRPGLLRSRAFWITVAVDIIVLAVIVLSFLTWQGGREERQRLVREWQDRVDRDLDDELKHLASRGIPISRENISAFAGDSWSEFRGFVNLGRNAASARDIRANFLKAESLINRLSFDAQRGWGASAADNHTRGTPRTPHDTPLR